MANTITHHHLIRLDTPMPQPQEQPRWAPLITPMGVPGPGDDEDEDDGDDGDGDDSDDGGEKKKAKSRFLSSHNHHVLPDTLDKAHARTLLDRALAELGTVQRRYAHLPELRPVFMAVESVFNTALAPEEARRAAAITYARQAMERSGLDVRSAAERAVEVYRVNLAELLEALRARVVG